LNNFGFERILNFNFFKNLKWNPKKIVCCAWTFPDFYVFSFEYEISFDLNNFRNYYFFNMNKFQIWTIFGFEYFSNLNKF
jgi:hypothetical protein